MTYINGLQDVIEFKKQFPDQELILHSDQGSVYASKSYNELLPMYNITRSMSRAGTPTDNAAVIEHYFSVKPEYRKNGVWARERRDRPDAEETEGRS